MTTTLRSKCHSAFDPGDAHTAIHDPVPADSQVGVCGEAKEQPHGLETQVRHSLLQDPRLNFSSLVVRRVPAGGVCLSGILETDGTRADVAAAVNQVAGVECLMNHLLVRTVEQPLVTDSVD